MNTMERNVVVVFCLMLGKWAIQEETGWTAYILAQLGIDVQEIEGATYVLWPAGGV